MRFVEVVYAYGHGKIRATHPNTLEITKEGELTERGDCIIAVNSSKGALELDAKFKELAKKEQTQVTLILEVEGLVEVVKGFGDPRLSFTHPTDLVVRKSSYTCPRTLVVGADKAAVDLSRKMVSKLRKPETKVTIKLVAEL